MYITTERLYRTADDRLVPEGDPAGRFLYAPKGRRITDKEARKYGLLKPDEQGSPGEAEEEAAVVAFGGDETPADVPAEEPSAPVEDAPAEDQPPAEKGSKKGRFAGRKKAEE